ncbi:MAG: hypothetical protein DYG98_22070 [Haliscomenobacteraceae bacterium CHB4]|nr:hypothetical protein [Haliscomenobacteraceae bacterium CHB4]
MIEFDKVAPFKTKESVSVNWASVMIRVGTPLLIVPTVICCAKIEVKSVWASARNAHFKMVFILKSIFKMI